MLVRFSVENYLSFKDKVTLDLAADALKEKKDYVHVAYLHNPKLSLLKSIVLCGYNAFGKSNFIKAYDFFRKFTLTSFSYGKFSNEINVAPFSLNTETEGKPSFFEILFILGNTKYRYGFEVSKINVQSEWLYYADGPVRENILFQRIGQEFPELSKSWNKESENRIMQGKLFVKPSNLFLSLLMEQDKIPRIDEIGRWIRGNVILTGNYASIVNENVTSIYTKLEYRSAILRFLESPELGFTSVFEKINKYVSGGNLVKEAANYLFESEMINFDLFTSHNIYDKNHNFVKKVEFDLIKNESSGSIKYFILACYMAYVIKNSQLIWIDEFDSSLSTHLLSFLIKTYNSKTNNKAGSQMVFVSHNTVVLNKMLRRDQIWFVDKNKYGESSLVKGHTPKTPMRIDRSIEQDYRDGKVKGITNKNAKPKPPSLFDNDNTTG
ncbi:MAG TPA: ATP-binding protein [Hanamia sp.]